MTVEQIKLEIESLIAMGPDVEKERPKVEFKSRWPDLKTEAGISEFLKDTSAIANTVGLDGFLIFGYDPKINEFNQASFKDSKLRDQNEIRGLLIKGLSEPFEIELYSISINDNQIDVLHIPPSVHKPHVIKQHRLYYKDGILRGTEENRILVRKSGGNYPATKYDIDFMYYDRKNITPEYEAFASLKLSRSRFYIDLIGGPVGIKLDFPITIENTGRRPFLIEDVKLSISLFEDEQAIHFEKYRDPLFESRILPLKSQELSQYEWRFKSPLYAFNSHNEASDKAYDLDQNKSHLIIKEFVLITSSGENIIPKIQKV